MTKDKNLKNFDNNKEKTESSDPSYDNLVVNESLNLIAKGAGIILVGTFIGSILSAIFPIIIARFYTPVEFGIYALAMTVFLFLTRISYLGLDDGCPRNISFYRGKKDYEKVKGVVDSSFQFIILSSILASVLLFLIADWLSLNIFNNENLSIPLKLLSISLPFFVLTGIIISVFRGFDRANENVYFAHILTGVGKILLVIPVIVIGLSFNYVFLAIAGNIILVFLIALIYYKIRKPKEIKIKKSKKIPVKKELLFFSLPLVFSGMAWFLLQGTDKFMIGLIMQEYDVGLYNAACTVSTYLNIFLVSIMFIYQPVGTKLFGAGKNLEIKKLYQTITKWVFLLASPVIMFVFLQPETTISILFGSEYSGAVFSLLVLFLAYTIRICLGPAGGSVIMLGKTKQLMYIVAFIAIANIVLNWLLIPIYGISGAAFATAISVLILSLLELGYLYRISRIQPIKKLYLKILCVYLFLMVFVYYIFNYLPFTFSALTKIILVVFSYILFFVLLIVFNLFREEDLLFVEIIEQKLGKRIPLIRRIIR